MGRPTVSRRAVLRTAAGLGIASLAGCSGSGETAETPTPSEDSVFREITYEGPNLVVLLREGHEVTRLNLIAPDGSLSTQTSVATGATKASLQILDIRAGLAGYDHYAPGLYELVAMVGERTESLALELRPELRITDVSQFREGERGADFGRLAVSVENVGTGPTWVYDITYRESPNLGANDKLIDDPGLPQIARPNQPNQLIISPGAQQTYVAFTTPLLFTNQESQKCQGEHEMTLVIGNAAGDHLEQSVTALIGGETQTAGLLGEYTCSDVGIELSDGDLGA